MSLTRIWLDHTALKNETGGGGAARNFDVFVRSSIDGFASNLFASHYGGSSVVTFYRKGTRLDTRPAYQNLTEPVEFRVYCFGSTGVWGSHVDNITVRGCVYRDAPYGTVITVQ